jgi:hypothetical protein
MADEGEESTVTFDGKWAKGVHAREQEGALPAVDTVPILAKGIFAIESTGRCYTSLAERTAGVELAGRAEKATTVKPEALEPGAYGEAGRGPRSSGDGGDKCRCLLEGGSGDMRYNDDRAECQLDLFCSSRHYFPRTAIGMPCDDREVPV